MSLAFLPGGNAFIEEYERWRIRHDKMSGRYQVWRSGQGEEGGGAIPMVAEYDHEGPAKQALEDFARNAAMRQALIALMVKMAHKMNS